jgi:hypothetical protein
MFIPSIRVSCVNALQLLTVNGGTADDGVVPVGIVILSKVCSIIALSSTRAADTTTRYRSPCVGALVGPAQIVVGIRAFSAVRLKAILPPFICVYL